MCIYYRADGPDAVRKLVEGKKRRTPDFYKPAITPYEVTLPQRFFCDLLLDSPKIILNRPRLLCYWNSDCHIIHFGLKCSFCKAKTIRPPQTKHQHWICKAFYRCAHTCSGIVLKLSNGHYGQLNTQNMRLAVWDTYMDKVRGKHKVPWKVERMVDAEKLIITWLFLLCLWLQLNGYNRSAHFVKDHG